MKLNKNFVIVIGVMVIITLGYLLLQKTSDNSLLTYRIEQSQKKADTLKELMNLKSEQFQKEREGLYKKLDSLTIAYRTNLNEINKKYIKEHEIVKKLSLTEGVKLLKTNIGEFNNLPKINVIDMDTTVSIAKNHVGIINNEYLFNSELKEKNKLLLSTNDSLFSAVKKSKYIIDLRTDEISLCRNVNVQNDITINALNELLSQQRKANRKKTFKIVLITGIVGITTGALLLK